MKVYSEKIVQLKLSDILSVVPMTEENVTDWAAIEQMDSSVKAYQNVKTFERWATDTLPVFKPLIPTGYSSVRRDYATSIARELGAQLAGVQFASDCVSDLGVIPPFLVKVVMAAGVMVDGKVMNLRYMTQSAKSNDAILPLVDREWGDEMSAFFPDPADTVRPGALHSPLRGGFFRTKVNVLVVEDDDNTYRMVGDGQGIVDRRKMIAKGVRIDDSPQFRAVIGMDKPWGERILGKGTLYMAGLPKGVDMVLPRGCIKANKGVQIENGMYTWDMAFGIMNGQGERLAGPMYIGEQVWQWATADVTKAADDLVGTKLAELRAKVNDTAWLAERGYELRDEEGNLQQFEIVKMFAEVCMKLGNNKLMHTQMIVDSLTDWVATVAHQTIAGLGTYAWRFRAVARRTLSDGVVAINPKVFKHLFGDVEGEVVTVAIRYPFAHRDEMVAVRVMADPRVRWYEAHVNAKTMNRSALDFDGDAFALLRPDKHVLLSRAKVADLPWLEEKVRQKAAAPKRKSVMISQSMASSVGMIDHVISKLVAVWHLVVTHRSQADANIRIARVELQKAVDSVKKAATANMPLVNALSQWAGNLVNREDYAFRKLRKNVNLRPFKPFEGTLDEAKIISEMMTNGKSKNLIAPGKVIMPSIFLGDKNPESMVPLSGFIVRHEDEVPLISQMWLPNKTFARWLPVIKGPGFDWATDIIGKLHERLEGIRKDVMAKKIDEDKAKEMRGELFSGYREVWKAKRTEMAEDKAWLESAASAIWANFTAGNGKGFALKYSIPEVVAEMLVARKDEIEKSNAQIGRILGGEEFRAKYMTHDEEYLVVEVVNKDGGLAVVADGGVPHAVKDVVVPLGNHRVKIAVTGVKSLSVMFTGDILDESFDLPISAHAEPEWEVVDYAAFEGEIIDIDTDVM